MATSYYCNLGVDFQDQTGADNSGNKYYGPGGLQAAIRGSGAATALVADDTIYVKGEGNLQRLVWLECGKDVSGWAVGDYVTDNNTKSEWQGYICEISYGTNVDEILVQLNSTFVLADITLANGIEDFDQGPDNTTLTDKAAKGIEVDTNSGAADAGTPIRARGLNASWVEDGITRAKLDGDGVAVNCLTADDIDGWTFENWECDQATGHNVLLTDTDHAIRWAFVNCLSHDSAGGSGWGRGTKYWQYCAFIGCQSYDNNTDGFGLSYYSHFPLCTAIGNGDNGFHLGAGCSTIACIAHANTGYGVQHNYSGALTAFCVIDGNLKHGLYAYQAMEIAFANRITNNGDVGTEYGIGVSTATLWDLWNYFDGNNGGKRTGSLCIHAYKGSETELDTGEGPIGYEALASDKFELVLGAGGYRVEVALDANNTARFPVGLPNMPLLKVRG